MKELSIKEIEDEKIIKHLITLFKHEYGENSNARFAGIKVKDIIAWLEKQGEQETLCDKCRKEHPSHSCQDITELGRCAVEHEQNHIDKVKPKFHEGDWIINSQGTLRHIINVDEGGYQTDGGWLNHYTYEKTFHLWTIKDAKAGDILYAKICDEEWLYLYSSLIDDTDFPGLLEKSWINNYCCLRKNDSWFSHVEQEAYPVNEYSIISPATKEQRDTLMKAMTDAGYTFDFEKKELKKVEQKHTEWSDTDYVMQRAALEILMASPKTVASTILKESVIVWLQSLKDRLHPKQDSTDRFFEGFKKGEQSVLENYGKYGLCKLTEWRKHK